MPNLAPFIEEDGRENGHICTHCVDWIEKNAVATTAFNYRAYKTAEQAMRITINPRDLHPQFLSVFQDEDDIQNFLDSLSEYECSIIQQHRHNLNILKQIYDDVMSDLEETSKDLAME